MATNVLPTLTEETKFAKCWRQQMLSAMEGPLLLLLQQLPPLLRQQQQHLQQAVVAATAPLPSLSETKCYSDVASHDRNAWRSFRDTLSMPSKANHHRSKGGTVLSACVTISGPKHPGRL